MKNDNFIPCEIGNHHMVNGYKIDVKKAISKNDMNNMGPRGGGGGHTQHGDTRW